MSNKRLNVEKIQAIFFRNPARPQISTFSLGQTLCLLWEKCLFWVGTVVIKFSGWGVVQQKFPDMEDSMRHQVMESLISLHTENDEFFLAHDSYEIQFESVQEWMPDNLYKFLEENFQEKIELKAADESEFVKSSESSDIKSWSQRTIFAELRIFTERKFDVSELMPTFDIFPEILNVDLMYFTETESRKNFIFALETTASEDFVDELFMYIEEELAQAIFYDFPYLENHTFEKLGDISGLGPKYILSFGLIKYDQKNQL